jgi:hypothetical protein
MEGDNDSNTKLEAYNDFLRQTARDRKLPLADLYAAELEGLKAIPADAPNKHLTVDGVHMNPHGDQMMALGVLKAFGLSDAQLAQVKEHWQDEPNGAVAQAGAVIHGQDSITLRQGDAIEQLALGAKQTPAEYLAPAYFSALLDQARADATQQDFTALQKEANAAFAQKLPDLLQKPPPPPPPATPAPPAK